MRKIWLGFVAAAILALGIRQAQATTYPLSLTGTGAAFNITYPPGYEDWTEILSGTTSPLIADVQVGDEIDATITLSDGSYTLPAPASSPGLTGILWLFGNAFPSGNTETTLLSMQFSNEGTTVLTSGPGPTSFDSGALASAPSFFNTGPTTFNQITDDFTITEIAGSLTYAGSVEIDSAIMELTEPEPAPPVIPEPATMTLLGLGLAGLVGRQIRRRK